MVLVAYLWRSSPLLIPSLSQNDFIRNDDDDDGGYGDMIKKETHYVTWKIAKLSAFAMSQL